MPTFSTNGQKFHLYGLPYVDVKTELSIFDSKITVNPVDFGESRITITNTALVTPSAEDQKEAHKNQSNCEVSYPVNLILQLH